eukprot:TRINITY_DN10659_c0_g1_i1.p1 TRINITY_DN10659_c0_g1~~TRINITY_DN10659_c0_g1_i1.p1  ORF type:complete len:350 (+),score=69.52 TRINITY_DN10659_c0_g1_i1:198-1247(+)
MRSPRREGGGNSGQEVAVVMAVAAVMAPVQRLQSKKKIRTKQQQQTQHSKQPKSATFSQLKSAPPPKKVHAPPVDFSKIAAAKKAAAKSSAKIEKPQTTVEIGIKEPEPPKLADDDLLPQGFEGAKWKALEDSMIRKERDVKSARCGSIQEGETCVQTGPWRAEPSGRVRMPIQGPQKVEGWVTVDTRRCRNAEGEWGNLLYLSCSALRKTLRSKKQMSPLEKPCSSRRLAVAKQRRSPQLQQRRLLLQRGKQQAKRSSRSWMSCSIFGELISKTTCRLVLMLVLVEMTMMRMLRRIRTSKPILPGTLEIQLQLLLMPVTVVLVRVLVKELGQSNQPTGIRSFPKLNGN